MPPTDTSPQLLTAFISATTTHGIYGQVAQTYETVAAIAKPISFLVSVGLLAAAVYFIVATNWYVSRRNRIRDTMWKSNYAKRRTSKVWREIEHHAIAGDEKDWRIAILEADKVLDETLKNSGFPGIDLGDRLKRMNETQLSIINEVWEAHKLRNKIAHEIDFKLTHQLAERAISIYKQAFKELGLFE